MKRFTFCLTAFFATAFLMTSCCQCNRYDKRYGKPLEKTKWMLTQWQGQEVAYEDSYYLMFDGEGGFSGKADCNTIGGQYTFKFDKASHNRSGLIELDNIFSTRMACPEASREYEFIEMLNNAYSFSKEGPLLYIFVDSELVAVFQGE